MTEVEVFRQEAAAWLSANRHHAPLLHGASATGMLAAPGGRIAGGSIQVQRNIIGERLLGLPREPKPM